MQVTMQRFSIETAGGYVASMIDAGGKPILYEQTTIDDKRRGGSHVCLPQFGPDQSGALAQHGFGRDREWNVAAQTPTSIELELSSSELPADWRGLEAMLMYAQDENCFVMRLTLGNSAMSSREVAPAFHPYFYVPEGVTVELNGIPIDTTQYAGTEFIEGYRQKLQIDQRRFVLESHNLPVWALWSDNKGEYFCVEPSHSGESFNSNGRQPLALQPGEEQAFELRITQLADA